MPADAFVFLSIGFIQPHKGFDRAVRAFAGLDASGARLDVVGSVRVEEPAYVAYLGELTELVRATDGAYLHEGFVSDELFDRWIVACDVVVLPYRSIWSSGVLERARLFDRPVIATAVGGLPEQAGLGDQVVLVGGDAELRQAMRVAAGQDVAAVTDSVPWPAAGVGLRDRVQEEVVARASAHRGTRLVSARRTPDRAAGGSGSGSVAVASAALRRVRTLDLPAATASHPLARLAKRAVRRLTAWEVDPVVHQLNTLRAATLEAIEAAIAGRIDHADRNDSAAHRGGRNRPAVSADRVVGSARAGVGRDGQDGGRAG